MGKHVQAETAAALALRTEYSTPYSAVLRDDIVMGVPRYFLERWVPILGTSSATLVNTLRQLDYRCQGDSIIISGETLAQESGMSRRHLYKCLETPWINAFVRQESGEKHRSEDGTITQQANRYRVRMDDPLTPADADRLVEILSNLADDPLKAAQAALERHPQNLWAEDATNIPVSFTTPRALTAHDVLQRAFPTWQAQNQEDEQQFARISESLHRHLVLTRDDGRTRKIIVPQYFRKQWWTRLGHDLAWAYLWLRGEVYENDETGIRRDTCWIPALDVVLKIIGRTREWWRRNVENSSEKDGWNLTDFFTQIDSQKGRDQTHPQRVARQFRVSLEIPIAPEDRATYESLLNTWPVSGILPPASSATNKHTGLNKVHHKQTHWYQRGAPQTDTPASAGYATNEHTKNTEVRHIHTQGSAISVHRNTESEELLVLPEIILVPNSTQSATNKLELRNSLPESSAAAKTINSSKTPTASALSREPNSPVNLVEELAERLISAPDTPLYLCVDPMIWLTQVWPEPIQPHTPAWDRVMGGVLNARHLVALILAVWVDTSIKHPPRYLSWLVQRWESQPESPPVLHWETWLNLADLPVGQWLSEGRRIWIEIAPSERRELPFGLEILSMNGAKEHRSSDHTERLDYYGTEQTTSLYLREIISNDCENLSDGLNTCPNEDGLNVRYIWQATLGQLRLQLNSATYTNWVEGSRAVSFTDGLLTVEARNRTASDWLSTRLNHTIERTVSSLAGGPIQVVFQFPNHSSRL